MNKIRRLNPDEIECRVSQVTAKGCSLLLYKTARTDRAILDETFGELWQNDFKVIDDKMYGGIGIYNKELNQWLWRWDCGTESNTEKEKGQASDAFKRAGFKWGIGIELYTAPFIWLNVKTEKNDKGKYQLENKFAKYFVKSIDYADNGNIKDLIIVDANNKQVYSMQKNTNNEKQKDDTQIYITLAKINDIDTIKSFYEANKENVKDRQAFHEMAQQRIKAIKEIKANYKEE